MIISIITTSCSGHRLAAIAVAITITIAIAIVVAAFLVSSSRRFVPIAIRHHFATTGGYDCVYALACLRCASSCVCRACARLRARSASRATHSRRSRGAIHHHLLHLTDPSTTMTLRCAAAAEEARGV